MILRIITFLTSKPPSWRKPGASVRLCLLINTLHTLFAMKMKGLSGCFDGSNYDEEINNPSE